MKKIMLLFVLMLSISIQAQEHLKFMGIPIDGSVEKFAKKLEAKGLKKVSKPNERVMLAGTFAGNEDCYIMLSSGNGQNKTIEGVGVILPASDSWSIVMTKYQTLKTQLSTKYGKPTTVEEEFYKYEPSTDFLRFYEVQNGNAIFKTSFYSEEGYIALNISSVEIGKGYVQLIYVDNANSLMRNKDALDDL